jgi:benzodiazapine receptor
MKFDLSIIWIFIPIIFGMLVGRIGRPDDWYKKLKKPYLNPPSYLFGIVWTILYIMIGISFYLAIQGRNDYYIYLLLIFHLILNFSFSPSYFYFKQLLLSSIITSLVLLTILWIIYEFFIDNRIISVYLLIPYVIWLLFANYLSWSIYFLNK